MRAGRVVQAGAPAEVWRHPADEWTAAFLGFGPAVDGACRRRRPRDAVGDARRSRRERRARGRASWCRPTRCALDAAGPIAGDGRAARVRGRPRRARRSTRAVPRCACGVPRPATRPTVGAPVRLAIDADARARVSGLSARAGRLTRMATGPPKVEAGARELAKRDPVLKRRAEGARPARPASGRGPAKTHFAELARIDLLPAARGPRRGRDPRPLRRAVRRPAHARGGARAVDGGAAQRRPVGQQGHVDRRPRGEGRRRARGARPHEPAPRRRGRAASSSSCAASASGPRTCS